MDESLGVGGGTGDKDHGGEGGPIPEPEVTDVQHPAPEAGTSAPAAAQRPGLEEPIPKPNSVVGEIIIEEDFGLQQNANTNGRPGKGNHEHMHWQRRGHSTVASPIPEENVSSPVADDNITSPISQRRKVEHDNYKQPPKPNDIGDDMKERSASRGYKEEIGRGRGRKRYAGPSQRKSGHYSPTASSSSAQSFQTSGAVTAADREVPRLSPAPRGTTPPPKPDSIPSHSLGSSLYPETSASSLAETRTLEDEHRAPLLVGRDPPPPLHIQPEVIANVPPQGRNLVKICRCACLVYTMLLTLVCIIAIIVWIEHISPTKRTVKYFTSLSEVTALESALKHRLTSSKVTISANCSNPVIPDLRFQISESCNVGTVPFSSGPALSPITTVHQGQTGSDTIGLTHHVFNMWENATLDITVCLLTSGSPNDYALTFFLFESAEDMMKWEKRSPDDRQFGYLSSMVFRNCGMPCCPKKFPNTKPFRGHHYFTTQLILYGTPQYPLNLSYQFDLTTLRYSPTHLTSCKNNKCSIHYKVFPWELFGHSRCLYLSIGTNYSPLTYSTLFPVCQTFHRRTDMPLYFMAFALITILGSLVVFSCPICEQLKNMRMRLRNYRHIQ